MRKILSVKNFKFKNLSYKNLYKSRMISLFLSLVLLLTFLFGGIGGKSLFSSVASAMESSKSSSSNLQDDGVIRPEELDEGISRKSFQDMEGRRVTVRQPYMDVVSRSVDRTEAQLLSDKFQFIDPNTHAPYEGLGDDIANIDFTQYGALGDENDPRYPMRGLDNDKNERYFSNFQKYMLLRQAWFYRSEINKNLSNNNLKNVLRKHPAADGIYGKIEAGAKAVSKVIISDPIYRSPLTTGLYLAPGEVVTVQVSGLKDNEKVTLTTHQQDSLGYDGGIPKDFDVSSDSGYNGLGSTEKYFRYWDTQLINEAKRASEQGDEPNYELGFMLQNQWQFQNQKVPCMGSIFELSNGEFQIGSIYGGPLYLQPTKSIVKLTITGAVETPHFILGVTTASEFNEHLRKAPGLIATLDVENGQLIGFADYMKNCDNIEKLGYFWHSVFAINSSLNGRQYNYNVTMAYDLHVPAGEAVALNSSFAAQPYGWFEACMNYETLTTKGNWGTFHELGHIQAKTYGVNWGMCSSNCKEPCEGEVWNNTLIILMYSLLCNMDSRYIKVEHGEYVHPFSSVMRSMSVQKVYDYHDFNNTKGAHFDQLSLYSTLIHSFGPEKFIDFFYTYNVNPSFCNNARADFIYRIGLVDHVNIFNWINENYAGNVSENEFTSEQLEFLKVLPDFYPIAYEWANGIDGNETARKYDVDGKHETIFNLSKSSFACPKDFTILKVNDPVYGTIKFDRENERAIYTPPTNIMENDSFSIVVSTQGGRIVTLNVNMNLVYKGSFVEVFKLDPNTPTGTKIEDIISLKAGEVPSSTEVSMAAGKLSFNKNEKEYYHVQFSFKAKTSGLYKFTVRGDDAKVAYFKKDGDFITRGNGIKYSNRNSNYYKPSDGDNHFAETYLQEGEIVDVDCHLINWGGDGFVNVGVVFPGESVAVDIPFENISNDEVSEDELEIVESFKGWQPQFLDSIKDESIDYVDDNTGWEVLQYPEFQLGDGDGPSSLVDGNPNTHFHSRYSGYKPPFPHIFVIDCKSNLSVNYFEILRRSQNQDILWEFALYGAKDDGSGELPSDDKFVELFNGKNPNPSSSVHRITFEEQEIRYFKFIVFSNNGQTVIKELTAGRMVSLNQTVKPKNYEKNQSGFTENSANGKLSTTENNAFYEFEFLGSGFDVFADTDLDYGTAKVYIDDGEAGEINLSDKLIFNKCVFRISDLPVKNHNVKIVTTSNKNFNISFINVIYGTPVAESDYPSMDDEYGDETPLTFSTEWRTLVQNYKDLTSIQFLKNEPEGFEDTYIRMNNFIRVYVDQNDKSKIAFVYRGDIVSPSDCSSLFAGCTSLKNINFENFDTANMLFANSMFKGCLSIETLDLSKFNTEQTLFLSMIFENCSNLRELNISGFTINSNACIVDFLKGCENIEKLYMPKIFRSSIQFSNQFEDKENKSFSDVATSKNEGHVLFKHEHVFEHCDMVPAQIGKEGIKEHYACSCGILLVDGEEVSFESLIIAPLKSESNIAIIVGSVCAATVIFGGTIFFALHYRKKKSKENKRKG